MSQTSFDPRIVIRPRTLDETIDLSLSYLQASFKAFRRLFLIVFFAEIGLLVLLHSALPSGVAEGLALAILVLLSPHFERAVTIFAGRHLFGNDITVGRALWSVLKASPLIAVVTVLTFIPVIVLAMVIGFASPETAGAVGASIAIPALAWPFLLAHRVYFPEVYHLEEVSVGRALSRSRALVSHRVGHATGLVLTLLLVRVSIAVLFGESISFILDSLLQFHGADDALGFWPTLAGYAFAGPFIALIRLFDYVDTRTRREGWDIQVRFNAIAQRVQRDEARSLTV